MNISDKPRMKMTPSTEHIGRTSPKIHSEGVARPATRWSRMVWYSLMPGCRRVVEHAIQISFISDSWNSSLSYIILYLWHFLIKVERLEKCPVWSYTTLFLKYCYLGFVVSSLGILRRIFWNARIWGFRFLVAYLCLRATPATIAPHPPHPHHFRFPTFGVRTLPTFWGLNIYM